MKGKILAGIISILLMSLSFAYAATTCTFTTVGTTMTLDGDCITDATLLVPDGYTLDGAGYTITANDPVAGHFVGAVVKNDGATAHVKNLGVAASGLANVCDGGDDRLRGIMFEEASGSIMDNTITNINQGNSGCQEGNAVEVRNAPFGGTHPNTQTVTIKNNYIDDYQKTGIVANGDVLAYISNNFIGDAYSGAQNFLAANSVQFGFGGGGSLTNNNIMGNQWCGPSDFASTAVLLFEAADGTVVSQNVIGGNSDIGIYAQLNNAAIINNKISDDSVADCNQFGYDIGIGDYGTENNIKNNKAKGFQTPYDGVTGEKNKVIPGS